MSSSSIPEPILDAADSAEAEIEVDSMVPEAPTPIQLPSNPMVFLQAAQFTLLLVAALYLTRAIVLPIVLAVLLKLLLQSGMPRLEKMHVPRVIAPWP